MNTQFFSSRLETIVVKNPFAPHLRLILSLEFHLRSIHLMRDFCEIHSPINLSIRACTCINWMFVLVLGVLISYLGVSVILGMHILEPLLIDFPYFRSNLYLGGLYGSSMFPTLPILVKAIIRKSSIQAFKMFVIHKSNQYSCKGKYTREIQVNTYLVIELAHN